MKDSMLEIAAALRLLDGKLNYLTTRVESEGKGASGLLVPGSVTKETVLLASASPPSNPDDNELRYPGQLWWRCDIFNTCQADLNGNVWVVNSKTGEIPTWNLIETTCTNGHVPGFDPKQGGWLHSASQSTSCYYGWGNHRDGKHDKATVWVKLYCYFYTQVWRFTFG